ncbi:LuxR C-terminal-related transcriptional regulator [Egbenema bharatensis]|uniref:LuxR C-terminal-related transcriptional regulator n=1 Tax=Egbenema bharatensis TaxID=3463334 RepID=UPI003A89860E
MSEPVTQLLDSMRLLVDLQRVSAVVQRLNGCLDPDEIAKRATDGLIEQFDCAFARIWLMEPDQTSLRLVASSGIYTRTDGFFARVPVGSFKVGKIAQNRIPFLSNHLPDEPWVKDRQWAIDHNITGFAGYPLAIGDTVTGVMAVFSHHPLTPEFLEVLQGLCTTLAIALENALLHQQQIQLSHRTAYTVPPLSDRLAEILIRTRLSLVGTEHPLSTSTTYILLQMAEVLAEVDCTYCRLIYELDYVALEAMIFPPELSYPAVQDWVASQFSSVLQSVTCSGGTLQMLAGANQKLFQVALRVPYPRCHVTAWLRIHCAQPILQTAFTQLAYQAGLNVCSMGSSEIPLLTDDVTQIKSSRQVLWVDDGTPPPLGIVGKVNLRITPLELREAVNTVLQGESWGLADSEDTSPVLSEREREILSLLAEGLRDRDIAHQLHISERTVKFHLNNVLTKLGARTRCQAIYQSAVKGWIL